MSAPLTFTIPSIHNNTELHCRVYHPQALRRGPKKLGAIIAHPWASLGGSYDDPAVLAAAQALVEKGYVVGTFNFRGARPSKGSGSWSGKPEVADYMSFVGFFVHYLERLRWEPAPQGIVQESNAQRPDTTTTSPSKNVGSPGSISLILGGYSYGAVILSNLPSLESIRSQFTTTKSQSTHGKIVKTASKLSAQTSGRVCPPIDNPSSLQRPDIEAWYLFISPVVGALQKFLHWRPPANDGMWENKILVVHGSSDHFTSVDSVRKWVRGPRADLKIVKNGHFWMEPDMENALMKLIQEWATRE